MQKGLHGMKVLFIKKTPREITMYKGWTKRGSRVQVDDPLFIIKIHIIIVQVIICLMKEGFLNNFMYTRFVFFY